jgi:putative PEP-CTERM system TPR-repeat lipoprotein
MLTGTGCSPRDSAARHLESAGHYFASGQYDQAEVEYLNVLNLDPRSATAIGRLGEIYFADGRIGQILPFLLRGRDLQPDNLALRLKLGQYYLSAGKLKQARTEADFILERNSQDPEALLLLAGSASGPEEIAEVHDRLTKLPPPAGTPVLVALGTLEFREHKFTEAEANLIKAKELDPKSDAAWSALGALYWAQNNLPGAEAAFATAAGLAPARSPIRLRQAQFEIQTGQVESGRKALLEMTENTPDYLPAWMTLAELAAREKKFSESTARNARVLARDPVHPEALLLEARLKLEAGDAAAAVATLQGALKLYPQSVPLLYQLGVASLRTGDLGQAATNLNQAITLAPGFVDAVVLLADVTLRRGDAQGAIVLLKQLVQQQPDALPRAWFLLAEAYRNAGDFDEAMAVYRRADAAAPANPQTSWLMGLILLQQNRRDEARQAFVQALDRSPDFLPALEQLVDLDLAAGQAPEALRLIEPRLEKKPDEAGLHVLRARACLALSNPDQKQAEAELQRALELQPESAAAYLMLARLYAATNRQEQALVDLRKLTAKDPKNTAALMITAAILDQQKDYAGARDTYEHLLTINPRFSPALNNLAYLYAERFKLLDQAYEMARRARDLLPDEPHTADTLGWILYQRREYPRALALLEESAASLPGSPEIQFHLGMARHMMGEKGPARLALQHALDLKLDAESAAEARRILANPN